MFKIFISHKVQRDGASAQRLKELLEEPCREDVTVFISEDITHGQTWREQIREKLLGSDMLLLLYTDSTMDWDWCLYEAGLFTHLAHHAGGATDGKKSVVYIYPAGGKKPPPLDHLQGVEAKKEELSKFLCNLYTTTEYCDQVLLSGMNPKYFADKIAEDLAANVLSALKLVKSKTRKYGIHLDLVIKDPKALDAGIPGSAQIKGEKEDYKLFGSDEGDWTWSDFEQTLTNKDDRKWLDELAGELLKARDSKLVTPIQSTFHPQGLLRGNEYLPFLEQVERRGDDSMRCSIVFAEQPKWNDERGKTKSILSFSQLIDELKGLIDSTHENQMLRLLSFTPALGFLAMPERWQELEECIRTNNARVKVKITCLDKDSLEEWHDLFEGRKDAYGEKIKPEQVREATKAAEGLLAALAPPNKNKVVRKSWSELPEFYAFSNDERAIVVTPLFLPRLTHEKVTDAEIKRRGSLPNVEMVGLATSQKETVKKISEMLDLYSSGGSADAAAG